MFMNSNNKKRTKFIAKTRQRFLRLNQPNFFLANRRLKVKSSGFQKGPGRSKKKMIKEPKVLKKKERPQKMLRKTAMNWNLNLN